MKIKDFKTFLVERQELNEAKKNNMYMGKFEDMFIAFRLNGVNPNIQSKGQLFDAQRAGRDLMKSPDVIKGYISTKGQKGYDKAVKKWVADTNPSEFYIADRYPSSTWFSDVLLVYYRK